MVHDTDGCFKKRDENLATPTVTSRLFPSKAAMLHSASSPPDSEPAQGPADTREITDARTEGEPSVQHCTTQDFRWKPEPIRGQQTSSMNLQSSAPQVSQPPQPRHVEFPRKRARHAMTVASIMQASRSTSTTALPTQISDGSCTPAGLNTLDGREIPSIILPIDQAAGDIQYLREQYTGIHIIGLPRDLFVLDFESMLKPFGKIKGKIDWKGGQTWATVDFANTKKAEVARFKLANKTIGRQTITVGFDLSTGKSAASKSGTTMTSTR